jgi:hypothetical protein
MHAGACDLDVYWPREKEPKTHTQRRRAGHPAVENDGNIERRDARS